MRLLRRRRLSLLIEEKTAKVETVEKTAKVEEIVAPAAESAEPVAEKKAAEPAAESAVEGERKRPPRVEVVTPAKAEEAEKTGGCR